MELVGVETVAPPAPIAEPLVSEWKPQRPLTTFQRLRRRITPRGVFYVTWFLGWTTVMLVAAFRFKHLGAFSASFNLVNVLAMIVSNKRRYSAGRINPLLDDLNQPTPVSRSNTGWAKRNSARTMGLFW